MPEETSSCEIVHKVAFVKYSMSGDAFEITNGYRWEVLVFHGGDLFMKPIRFSHEDYMRGFINSLQQTLKLVEDKDFSIHVGHWGLTKEEAIRIKGKF